MGQGVLLLGLLQVQLSLQLAEFTTVCDAVAKRDVPTLHGWDLHVKFKASTKDDYPDTDHNTFKPQQLCADFNNISRRIISINSIDSIFKEDAIIPIVLNSF